MPIVVKHGDKAGTVAGQLVARAGLEGLARQHALLMQAQQLGARRQAQQADIAAQASLRQADWEARAGMQQADIESRAGLQEQMIGARESEIRLRAGLESQLQAHGIAQRKEAQLEMLQEQAKSDAWVWEYTPQQRREMAKKTNDYLRAMADPRFSESEKGIFTRDYNAYCNAQQPTRRMKTSEEEMLEELRAQGREPGAVWQGDGGGWYTTVFGSGGRPEAKLLVRPDQTPEAIQAKLAAEAAKARAARMVKVKDLMSAEFSKLRSDEQFHGKSDTELWRRVETTYGKEGRNARIEDEYGPEGLQQILDAEEAERQGIVPIQGMQQQQGAIPGPLPELRALQTMAAQGFHTEPEDYALPRGVGEAQAIMRTIRDKHEGKDPPPDAPQVVLDEWRKASMTMLAWEEMEKRKEELAKQPKQVPRRPAKKKIKRSHPLPNWGAAWPG